MRRINLPLAFWSLVLSCILWIVVFNQNVKNQVRIFPVPLEVSGLDTNYAVVKIPEEVQVSVTTSSDRIKRLMAMKLSAFVDVSRATPGSRSYPVKVFPQALQEAMGDQIITARVEIEEVSRRTIPVTIDTTGELQDTSLRVDNILSDPATVKVYGPKSEVNRAVSVRGILNLDQILNGGARTYTVYLEALGPDNRPLPNVKTEPLFSRVSASLGASPEEKQVILVPNLQGRPADGFSVTNTRIEPNQITLRGSGVALSRVNRVLTSEINLSGLKANTTVVSGVKPPAGTSLAGASRVKVFVEIKPVADLSPDKN